MISEALRKKKDNSDLLAEQVANNAMVAKILHDHRLESINSAKARRIISEELSWVLIDASIRHGELEHFVRKKLKEATSTQIRKRTQVLRVLVKQWFPRLPEEIIAETVRKFSRTYNKLVEKAIQKTSRISIA